MKQEKQSIREINIGIIIAFMASIFVYKYFEFIEQTGNIRQIAIVITFGIIFIPYLIVTKNFKYFFSFNHIRQSPTNTIAISAAIILLIAIIALAGQFG